jgi:membrane protease YdiL (CAAX protease family)
LLAPLWFFGFGAGEVLRDRLTSRAARLVCPVLLAIPYLVFAVPRGEFQWGFLVALVLIPVVLSALFEFSKLEQKLAWQDVVVLLSLALILELRLLSGAWPYPGLGSLPKLYLADVALYVYLVVRRLEGAGYSFVPSVSAFAIGLREWLFFAPIGIGLGLALHFIHFIPRHHSLLDIIAGLIITFLLTAVPEELFFRGILQNLLEPRIGAWSSLLLTSALFGLSHFHKGAAFNWRYVLLAFLAGIFYGRAWRARRQLLASSTTHTLVDVVWSLWFR